jgi:hypothetical protein
MIQQDIMYKWKNLKLRMMQNHMLYKRFVQSMRAIDHSDMLYMMIVQENLNKFQVHKPDKMNLQEVENKFQ